MKFLQIRIPMSDDKEVVPKSEWPAREKAAFEELLWLVPGLKKLKGSVPGLGTQAVGGQLYLCLILQPHPQMSLKLSDRTQALGRAIEIDPRALDQKALKESLQLTRDLLADASAQEPESLRQLVELLEKRSKSRAANRLRRVLGERFALDVFSETEIIQIPLVAPTYVAPEVRTFTARVTDMEGRTSFRGKRVAEIVGRDVLPLGDSRKLWSFVRRDRAQTYAEGQLIHASMELGGLLKVTGSFVVHEATGEPVAIEVSDVFKIPNDPQGTANSACDDSP